jgi:hypothetical protein
VVVVNGRGEEGRGEDEPEFDFSFFMKLSQSVDDLLRRVEESLKKGN